MLGTTNRSMATMSGAWLRRKVHQPWDGGPHRLTMYFATPTHQGLRSDDSDGPEHRWKPSIQQNQEQAIPICELDATPHPALQHNQLMTERRVLGLKSALRLERRDGQGQEEAEERDHRR